MYFKRSIEPILKKALQNFPALILTGPRQAGKTTLLKHTLKGSYSYVLLDELDKRSFAQNDPQGFFERYKPPVIIDEIQNVPTLLNYIKARIEEDRKPGNWVLTGSQQFSMMKNVSESLAGRAAVLHLHPFSISESFKNPLIPSKGFPAYVERIDKNTDHSKIHPISLGQWLLNGCYPELKQKRNSPIQLWYASYVQTYLDRDVRGNIKEGNLYDFQRFIKLLASRTAMELNQASLSKELGISIPTVRSWISLMEASSLIMLLPPYQKNFGKRIIKSPKLYFMDTGLVSYLVGLQTPEHLMSSPMAGALFETAVVTNFKKVSDAAGHMDSLYYWRAISGLEVDLLIDLAGELHPFEIKLSATINAHHYSNLTAWKELTSSKIKGHIISQSKDIGVVGPQVINSHWTQI